MFAKANQSSRQASILCAAILLALIATLSPAAALAAGATSSTQKILGIKVPASARVHPTTSAPATTTTSSTTTPASAQPGTVPPATTTPAGAIPQTTSTPASATPTTATPTTTTVPTGATPGAPATGSTTVVVVHKGKSHATRLSTGALVLAILGALLLFGCIVWALGRWLALEPRWTVSLMHSMREASYRASATWAEFSDWARIGH